MDSPLVPDTEPLSTQAMTWCDERLGFVQAADGLIGAPDAALIDARLASLPMGDLVRGWREQATTSLQAPTPGTHAFHMYFDRLALYHPERASTFIEAMLVHERVDALVALLAESCSAVAALSRPSPRPFCRPPCVPAPPPLLGVVGWRRRRMAEIGAKRRFLPIANQGYDSWSSHRAGRKYDFAVLRRRSLRLGRDHGRIGSRQAQGRQLEHPVRFPV